MKTLKRLDIKILLRCLFLIGLGSARSEFSEPALRQLAIKPVEYNRLSPEKKNEWVSQAFRTAALKKLAAFPGIATRSDIERALVLEISAMKTLHSFHGDSAASGVVLDEFFKEEVSTYFMLKNDYDRKVKEQEKEKRPVADGVEQPNFSKFSSFLAVFKRHGIKSGDPIAVSKPGYVGATRQFFDDFVMGAVEGASLEAVAELRPLISGPEYQETRENLLKKVAPQTLSEQVSQVQRDQMRSAIAEAVGLSPELSKKADVPDQGKVSHPDQIRPVDPNSASVGMLLEKVFAGNADRDQVQKQNDRFAKSADFAPHSPRSVESYHTIIGGQEVTQLVTVVDARDMFGDAFRARYGQNEPAIMENYVKDLERMTYSASSMIDVLEDHGIFNDKLSPVFRIGMKGTIQFVQKHIDDYFLDEKPSVGELLHLFRLLPSNESAYQPIRERLLSAAEELSRLSQDPSDLRQWMFFKAFEVTGKKNKSADENQRKLFSAYAKEYADRFCDKDMAMALAEIANHSPELFNHYPKFDPVTSKRLIGNMPGQSDGEAYRWAGQMLDTVFQEVAVLSRTEKAAYTKFLSSLIEPRKKAEVSIWFNALSHLDRRIAELAGSDPKMAAAKATMERKYAVKAPKGKMQSPNAKCAVISNVMFFGGPPGQ